MNFGNIMGDRRCNAGASLVIHSNEGKKDKMSLFQK